MTDTDPVTRIADNITDLTQPYSTSTTYTVGATTHLHTVHHASLLEQLSEAAEPSNARDENGNRTAASKPAASLDAIDLLATIRATTNAELWSVGIAATRILVTDLRKLVSAPWTTPQALTVARLTSRWVTTARIITAWETPPYTPRARCPICNTLGSLRIRLDQHTGLCTECRAMWEPATIGLLADHVRTSNGEAVA